MPFFLLGKGPDDSLTLLAPTAHATRQDALAELSRLTADASFSHWDAEVLVMDLDSGTPVLLVRPADAPVAASAPEEEPAEEPSAPADAAEEPADEPEEPVEEPEEPTEEPVEEAAAPEPEEPEAEESVEAEEPSESIVVEEEDVEIEATAEEQTEDAAEEPVVDEETSTEVVASEDEAAEADIAAVLQDLVAEEEAEALTAEVETVTPDDDTEPPAVVEVDEAWAAAVADTTEAENESGISLKDALLRTARQMEGEGIVAPESVGPADAEPGAVTEPEPVEAAEAVPAWPWDTQAPDTAPFALDALEEPGTDEGSLVRAAGDDDTMAAARPVILGAYGEAPLPPQPDVLPAIDLPEVSVDPAAAEPVLEPEIVPPPVSAEQVAEPAPEPAVSDFILDLDEVAPSPAAASEAGYSVTESTVAHMTCNDCVYVDTCPNKDQRDPSSCGSFQWK